MKKYILLYILLFTIASINVFARRSVKEEIQLHTLTSQTGSPIEVELDTALNNFAFSGSINDYSIANAFNGSLGSPMQSKIFKDRTEDNEFLFLRPYDAYFIAPTEIKFFNTKTPYTNLDYRKNGGTRAATDDFNALFSINANRKLNFTGLFNYMRALGLYSSQATKNVKAGIWSSYDGKWYAYNAAFMYQVLDNEENGGVLSHDYIVDKEKRSSDAISVPIRLSNEAMSRYKSHYFFLNHRVHIAHKKIEKSQGDSIKKIEYKPIASILHTFKWERSQKRFRESYQDSSFFDTTYFASPVTLDSTANSTYKNTLGFSINEGFSKYFPLSAIFYATHTYETYRTRNDSSYVSDAEHDLLVGAELSKRTGKLFLFEAVGEVHLIERKAGDLKIEGTISSLIPIKNDTLSLRAKAFFKNTSPTYYENFYTSNHFRWNNDFSRKQWTHIDGNITWKNKWVDLGVGVGFENLTNYVYFDDKALPAQYDGNIQVFWANADLNFKVWYFHLDNRMVYQKTSNGDVLPLPDFSTYNNFYAQFPLFKKELNLQLGVDVFYHTSYFAPKYMPATGAFYTQKEIKIGNYPMLSAYLSFHLKTARVFVKYYHFNASFMNHQYFTMPNYPLYDGRFQLGISWNFFT